MFDLFSGCLDSKAPHASHLNQTSRTDKLSHPSPFSLDFGDILSLTSPQANVTTLHDVQQSSSTQTSRSNADDSDLNLVWTEINNIKTQAASKCTHFSEPTIYDMIQET